VSVLEENRVEPRHFSRNEYVRQPEDVFAARRKEHSVAGFVQAWVLHAPLRINNNGHNTNLLERRDFNA
jgi:hypothetical protein